MAAPGLSPEELTRYARQIGPGCLSEEAQRRLKNSTALVARAGGMGGPAALALVMAGVGRVMIAHGGELISPDLNRQVLGCEQALGKPRAPHFAEYLRSMNRFVAVEAIDHEPDDEESQRLAHGAEVVLSCSPTFAERLRWNLAAIRAGVPLVDAAQWGMAGTLIAVDPGRTACLRCLYPTEPEFEEMFPVLGAISDGPRRDGCAGSRQDPRRGRQPVVRTPVDDRRLRGAVVAGRAAARSGLPVLRG